MIALLSGDPDKVISLLPVCDSYSNLLTLPHQPQVQRTPSLPFEVPNRNDPNLFWDLANRNLWIVGQISTHGCKKKVSAACSSSIPLLCSSMCPDGETCAGMGLMYDAEALNTYVVCGYYLILTLTTHNSERQQNNTETVFITRQSDLALS